MTRHFNKKERTPLRQKLRQELSKSEAILWTKLSRRQMMGYKFRRQHSVDQYVLDFFCPELKLAIEVDGDQHFETTAKKRDEIRQHHIESLGVRFLRISSWEVCTNVDGVVLYLQMQILRIASSEQG